ncbi:ABC transporter substrate-binding protein [candidate division KSB1 bacterium]|nr:ABC transporter substrate-binding protein [candidate division KSB1 bacterium]
MKTYRILAFILGLFLSISVYAQKSFDGNVTYIPEVETLFDQGVSAYQTGNYERARDVFARLLNEYPEHQRITATYLMLGKSYFKLEKYGSAITDLEKLITNFPKSSYVDDAHFTLGYCYYQQEMYIDAVKEFLWVADYAKNKTLQEKGRGYAFRMLDNHFELSELEQLQDEVTGKMGSAIVTLMLARQWDKLGNESRAVSLIEEYMRMHPDHKYKDLLNKYLEKTRSDQRSGEIKIGVLLPLSSEYKDEAQRILNGIKFAVHQYNQKSKADIRLIIKDTQGSIMTCIKAARDLALDERVIGIIGELESEKTASIAPIAEYNRIPLIAPVASDNGLAALSEFLFQINGDLEQRGALIAKYATLNDMYFDMSLNQSVESLMQSIRRDTSITDSMVYRNKTFATLAPADNYGKEITDSFTSMVDRLGGEIVAQKWYYENTQDLARQYKSLRDIGFARTNKDSIIEAMTADMTEYQKARFDEDKIPITTIDAIFMPIYTEELKYVIPQFAYANIKATLFGGQYWYNMDELRNRNVVAHVENLVFECDYFLESYDATFLKFRNDFRKVMNTSPGAMECYGFDATLVLLDAIDHDNLTRDAVRDYLNDMENFEGIRGPITFKNNRRVNTGQRILMFTKNRFELIH